MAQVGGLVVDAAHRTQGIGRELMLAAERWAVERGCVSVDVRSNVVRKDAHIFYERIGYRNAKTQYAFRKRLPDDAGSSFTMDGR